MLLQKISSYVLLTSLFLATPFAIRADVPVSVPTSGDITGTSGLTLYRNYQANFSGIGSVSNAGQYLNVLWNVTQTGNTYNYTYNFSYVGVPSSITTAPQINTIIIGAGAALTSANASSLITNLSQAYSSINTFKSTTSVDLGALPANLYGMGFLFNPTDGLSGRTISFSSTLAPIQGSIYGSNLVVNPIGPSGQPPPNDLYFDQTNPAVAGLYVSGGGTYVPGGSASYLLGGSFYNTGLASGSQWIPVPGLVVVSTPEPTTLLLLGSSIAAIGFRRSFRRTI